jgi:hypothetical protein
VRMGWDSEEIWSLRMFVESIGERVGSRSYCCERFTIVRREVDGGKEERLTTLARTSPVVATPKCLRISSANPPSTLDQHRSRLSHNVYRIFPGQMLTTVSVSWSYFKEDPTNRTHHRLGGNLHPLFSRIEQPPRSPILQDLQQPIPCPRSRLFPMDSGV